LCERVFTDHRVHSLQLQGGILLSPWIKYWNCPNRVSASLRPLVVHAVFNRADRGTVVAGVMTKVPTTTPSPGSTSCGDDIDCDVAPTDGCIYSSNGKRFIARCNVDFYGGDSGITFTDNLSGCIQQCANTAGCQAVSWSTGTCYLKSTTLQGVWNQWVMGMSSGPFVAVREGLIGCRCLPPTVTHLETRPLHTLIETFQVCYGLKLLRKCSSVRAHLETRYL
jgi:hypothetical protein